MPHFGNNSIIEQSKFLVINVISFAFGALAFYIYLYTYNTIVPANCIITQNMFYFALVYETKLI